MMGGYGSTRWSWHWKKTQVEECYSISIKTIKSHVRQIEREGGKVWGSIHWKRGEKHDGSIGYCIEQWEDKLAVRLRYTITPRNEEAQDYDYRVWLQATPLPWGGVRWWFTCPLIIDGKPCKRRVGKLYEPPGARYFGCRHCHDLTYRSSQEQHQYARFYADMALSFQDTYPGITSQEVRRFLDGEQDALFPWFLKRWMDEMQNHDPYAGYLTGENLCKESGLSMQNLAKLEAARLLLPDTKDKRYRPKLAGWARKLSHLLSEGWETEEIRRWAKGRWRAANPRQWPPDRKEWQS